MLKNMRDPVLALLHEGKENALSARQLAEILGTSPRAITKKVERLRRGGAPICASSSGDAGGFYIAVDDRELAAYLARRNHRARTVARATQAMQATLDLQRGQMTMWDDTENETPLR